MDSPSWLSGHCYRLFCYYWMGSEIFSRFCDEYGYGKRLCRILWRSDGNDGERSWHILVIALTVLLLVFGAAPLIEKANKILMPLFFLLFAVLAVRVFFLPGAKEGYEFLFVPKWEALANMDTWVMAMGQAFFSLSITGSGMIVYGSYLSKKEDIPKASLQTVFLIALQPCCPRWPLCRQFLLSESSRLQGHL